MYSYRGKLMAIPKAFENNQYTKAIRYAFSMKAWNSHFSKSRYDVIFFIIVREAERYAVKYPDTLWPKISSMSWGLSHDLARGVFDGELQMAIERLNGWQLSALIGSICEACDKLNEVAAWVGACRKEIIEAAKK